MLLYLYQFGDATNQNSVLVQYVALRKVFQLNDAYVWVYLHMYPCIYILTIGEPNRRI